MRSLRPRWLFEQTVHEGCDRGRLLRAGRVRRRLRLAPLHRQAGVLGAGGAVQRGQARLDGRDRRVPQRRRDLHRLHHAGLSRQVPAVHGPAAGLAALVRRGHDVRPRDPGAAPVHQASLNKEPSWRARPAQAGVTGHGEPLPRPKPSSGSLAAVFARDGRPHDRRAPPIDPPLPNLEAKYRDPRRAAAGRGVHGLSRPAASARRT